MICLLSNRKPETAENLSILIFYEECFTIYHQMINIQYTSWLIIEAAEPFVISIYHIDYWHC